MEETEERKITRKEKKTQAILRATRKIFLAKGFLDATMLDVAEELNISRRTLYLYFKSKEDLSFAAISDAFENLRDRVYTGAATADTGFEKLMALKQAYIDFYLNNFESFVFTLYFDYCLNRRTIHEPAAAKVFGTISEIEEFLVKILVQADADGTVRILGDPQRTAATILTVIHGYMQKVAIQQDYLVAMQEYSPAEMIESLFELLFQAIQVPE